MERKPVIGKNGEARPAAAAAGASGAGASGSRPAASVTPAPIALGIGSSLTRSNSSGSAAASSSAAAAGGAAKPRMTFKPTIPARKVKAEPVGDVKPAIQPLAGPSSAATRGRGNGLRGRGRGRGGAGLAGGPARPGPKQDDMIASGPFAMGPAQAASRAAASRQQAFVAAPPTNAAAVNKPTERKPIFTAQGEEYSDQEDAGIEIIDMELVPEQMGESAPTGLLRDRSMGDAVGEQRRPRRSNKVKREQQPPAAADADGVTVKPEPISPEDRSVPLPPRRRPREDDAMLSDDEDVDVDAQGRRVDVSASATPEVGSSKKQAVDLSDEEEEEEEEDLFGDFAQEPGYDNPEEKLYVFQFPDPFPHFVPNPALSLLNGIEDVKPEPGDTPSTATEGAPKSILKKSVAFADGEAPLPLSSSDEKPALKDQDPATSNGDTKDRSELRARELARKPEGRIGTLVVMKSGKTKMVLGDGIVLDVTAGVPTTFLQQVVHLDKPSRTAALLGEVHKTYVVTPDIDRLLDELRVHDGVVPGELDAAEVIKIE